MINKIDKSICDTGFNKHKELAEIKKVQKKIRDIKKKKLIIAIEEDSVQICGFNMAKFAPICSWKCTCSKKEGEPYNHYRTVVDGVLIYAVSNRGKKEIFANE